MLAVPGSLFSSPRGGGGYRRGEVQATVPPVKLTDPEACAKGILGNRLKTSLILNPGSAVFVFLVGVSAVAQTMAHTQKQVKSEILASFAVRQALPSEADGWKTGREDQIFTRDDIFDYVDGGGEIYLAYDFQFVFVREYVREGAPSIVVEVYQMSSSEDAFGVFTHDPDGEDVDLGQGALYGAGLLRFWKDKVFVRLMADRETPEAKALIMGLAAGIVGAIPGEGPEPNLIGCLPKEGLKPKSLRYFHTLISLNAHFYLANVNILNLSPETRVAMARFERAGSQARVLLVEYPTVERAIDAERRFAEMFLIERFMADRKLPPKKLEDGKYAGLSRDGRHLVIVVEADKKPDLEWLMRSISRNLEGAKP